MTNRVRPFSLSLIFITFGFIFLIIGLMASYLWANSIYNWERHLNKAFYTGELLYDSIVSNKVPPDGIKIQEYLRSNANEVSIKSLIQIYKKTKPNIITAVPLKDIYLFIVSNKIKYPISKLKKSANKLRFAPRPRTPGNRHNGIWPSARHATHKHNTQKRMQSWRGRRWFRTFLAQGLRPNASWPR